MKSTIRLFKSLPVAEYLDNVPNIHYVNEVLKKTIKKGFIFSSEILAEYSNIDDLIKKIETEY